METRREGRSMALRRTAMAGDVLACEFDADNPDLQVRWDNTLRYKLATRVERGDNKLDRSAATIGAGLSYRRNTPPNAQFLGVVDRVHRRDGRHAADQPLARSRMDRQCPRRRRHSLTA